MNTEFDGAFLTPPIWAVMRLGAGATAGNIVTVEDEAQKMRISAISRYGEAFIAVRALCLRG